MCNCDTNYNGRIILTKIQAPAEEKFEVRGIKPIVVKDRMEGDLRVIEISYKPYIPFSLIGAANPSILEVGQLASVTFTATISGGNEAIVSTRTVPAEEHTLGNKVITVIKDVRSDNPVKIVQEIYATDETGVEVGVSPYVNVSNRYIIGTMERNTTDVIQVGSKLASSMKEAYGSLRDYSIPLGEHHIVWLVPNGEDMGTVTDSNGFLCETVSGGNVSITNQYGVSIDYVIVKSKNFYAGESSLKLKF